MIGKNNIFNIRHNVSNDWLGEYGSNSRGFCNFATVGYAVRAGAYLIMRSYRKLGVVSYLGIISRFAPSSENDTESYVKYVCDKLHVSPGDEVSTVRQVSDLLSCMAWYETKYRISASLIFDYINLFKLKFYEKK